MYIVMEMMTYPILSDVVKHLFNGLNNLVLKSGINRHQLVIT